MRRTHDLALARLRLVARRWTGAPGPDVAPCVGGTASGLQDLHHAPGRAQGSSADGGDDIPDRDVGPGDSGPDLDHAPRSADERGSYADPDVDWPPVRLWVRLIIVLCALAVVGGFVALIVAWPRTGPATLEPAALAPAPPSTTPATGAPDAPFAGALAAPDAASSEAPWLLVHVAGEVRRPGIVRLPPGSRVNDALDAAGGLRRGGDVGSTNLARQLVDGERIEVGADSPPAVTDPGGAALPAVPAAPVDLNTATLEQLDALPGIGPITAAKIVAWRAANGRFTVVDELAEVSGIGPTTLAELRPLVRV